MIATPRQASIFNYQVKSFPSYESPHTAHNQIRWWIECNFFSLVLWFDSSRCVAGGSQNSPFSLTIDSTSRVLFHATFSFMLINKLLLLLLWLFVPLFYLAFPPEVFTSHWRLESGHIHLDLYKLSNIGTFLCSFCIAKELPQTRGITKP